MGKINLYSIFHLNLMYSSIEEENRKEVIQKCYWPLLNLSFAYPIAIEASGITLREINRIAPEFIQELKASIASGNVEFIGSGYSQIIAPLVPWKVNLWNLKFGRDVYKELLDIEPEIWYVNEQAYSSSLLSLYKGIAKAIVMEWNNPYSLHPEWKEEWGCRPQTVIDYVERNDTPVVWNNSVIWQKFQRVAHDDSLGSAELWQYLESFGGLSVDKYLCLYGSDAEVFNYRPGRFRAEKEIKTDEWERIRHIYQGLNERKNISLILPSEALKHKGKKKLRLETPSSPIVVKKQPKYNVTRWAVTGRDNVKINTNCYRMIDHGTDREKQMRLCGMWGSDYRSHITEKRWERLTKECAVGKCVGETPNYLYIVSDAVDIKLNKRKGLSIERLFFKRDEYSVILTIPHGYYRDIDLTPDWYSGNLTLHEIGKQQITDLEPCERIDVVEEDEFVVVTASIFMPGLDAMLYKTYTVWKKLPQIAIRYTLQCDRIPKGSLRLGNLTFNPQAFDKDTLFYATHNGGRHLEMFMLKGQTVDHGSPVSHSTSASGGLGATEGVIHFVDKDKDVRVWFDQKICAAMPMLTYRETGDEFFARLSFSCGEIDETRLDYVDGPLKFVMRIGG